MFVERPVGIDLGTTNSEIAILDPSERDLIVLADRFGRRTVPSAIAWDPKKNELLVGRAARNRRGRDPGPIESIKRKMGRDEKVKAGPHEMTPEEVSAKILEALRGGMQSDLAGRSEAGIEVKVERAVITVPAYFDAPQVEATRRAGELAGLEVLGILQEPTAAAIYHTWKRQLGDGCFLVYDLGGGTFDVSILRCLAGEYQVLAIDGDNYLGGDDFDRRFAEVLRAGLTERGYALDLDMRNDPEDRERFVKLVHLAQEVKESLSTSEVVHLNKTAILVDKEGEPVDFESDIGRTEYDAAISDLVGTTIEACRRALAQAQASAAVSIEDIDHVVLVGGSTRVPHVVERVTEELCSRSRSAVPMQDDVDTCVALGAAVHAAQLGGLRIGNEDAVICVRSPLVGRGDTLKITLDVERAPAAASTIRIENPEGESIAVAPLNEEGEQQDIRLDLPLGDDPEQAMVMVLDAGEGGSPSRLPLTVYRGDVRPRASGLSQASVVAKDISVEVLRAGRRDRKVLLGRGTGLPAEAEHTFFTGDRSGAVVLRLLQDRLPIKTLMLNVDAEVPVGTPVKLTLRCDDAMRLEAKAEVAGQELWANIEPARQSTPGADEVEALIDRAERVALSLWGQDASFFRRQIEPLITGAREVLGIDSDKLSALCARIESLLEEFEGASDGLNPPMRRFEEVVDALKRTVFRAGAPMLGMDPKAWEERIGEVVQKGIKYWEQGDAGGWRRTYNEAQALLETAHEDEFSRQRLDDPLHLARRLLKARLYAKRIEHLLADFVPSAAEEVKTLQFNERDRLTESLNAKVLTPLSRMNVDETAESDAVRKENQRIRQQLNQIWHEMERLDAALEKLPALGLVTERGGG